MLSEASNSQTPAELRATCAADEIVVLHPDEPELIGVASSLDAGAYTAEQVAAPAQSHQPLEAFTRRKLAEVVSRELRRAGLAPLETTVRLP